MVCILLGAASAHSGVAETQGPRLSLTAESRLILFAPYRVPAEFEVVGLPAAVAKALLDRSGQRESWQAAIVVDDRIIATAAASEPSATGGRAPSVIVVRGKGETQWAEGRADTPELSRHLFLVGALPFVLLGLAHAFATPRMPAESKGLSPRDPALREAMSKETILLTRRTNMWLAWVGFNLSHSLGAILFGGVVLLIGRSPASFLAQANLFLPLAVVVSGLYLVLGFRYWFRTPIIGIALSGVCFVASWAFFAIGG